MSPGTTTPTGSSRWRRSRSSLSSRRSWNASPRGKKKGRATRAAIVKEVVVLNLRQRERNPVCRRRRNGRNDVDDFHYLEFRQKAIHVVLLHVELVLRRLRCLLSAATIFCPLLAVEYPHSRFLSTSRPPFGRI